MALAQGVREDLLDHHDGPGRPAGGGEEWRGELARDVTLEERVPGVS
jgi:hypothetical protein